MTDFILVGDKDYDLRDKQHFLMRDTVINAYNNWADFYQNTEKLKMMNTKFEDFCVGCILVLALIAFSPILIPMFVILFIINLFDNKGNFKKAFKDTISKG